MAAPPMASRRTQTTTAGQLRPGLPTNPRRTPAHLSVSLLHSRNAATQLASNKTNSQSSSGTNHYDSPSSIQPLGWKNSSGESSNAERWFEKSNHTVKDSRASFPDNDPPFFLRHSSSSETPPDRQRQPRNAWDKDYAANSLPLRAELLQLGTESSSVDDFRSVIDDLTVENQKLKRKLRRYERVHHTHLQDEKLFEVRVHGLSAQKKRELEETLRKFASGLGPTHADAFPPNGYADLLPTLKAEKGATSHPALHQTDSAYASASGPASSAQSGDNSKKTTPSQYLATRRQNIHSYLHDMPEGLLPSQDPVNMTERAKKKLVVRKLEQIFAGKGAAIDGHQQSIQQQEVSQSAARTDRNELQAKGQRARLEGSREAPIMAHETEDPMNLEQGQEPQGIDVIKARPQPQENRDVHDSIHTSRDATNTEQRPTRPLDLDPDRAQNPAENFRYMRHLGFSPAEPNKPTEEDHGWIYLNFLINMAQLHTIHVTTDFVREALSDHSNKFEVSDDGRKVRWKGGQSITRTSSQDEDSFSDPVDDRTTAPRKRVKLSHNVKFGDTSVGGNLRAAGTSRQSGSNKFDYTPLFHKSNASSEAGSSSFGKDDNSSPLPATKSFPTGSNTIVGSASRAESGHLQKLRSKTRQKRDDGPMIFYNNVGFFADLSGDHISDGNHNTPTYRAAIGLAVGDPNVFPEQISEKRGPLAKTTTLPTPMELDDASGVDLDLSFISESPSRPPTVDVQEPVDFEVTGIGGVWPSDNFAISVQSRRAVPDNKHAPDASDHCDRFNTYLPPGVAKLLKSGRSKIAHHTACETKIVTTKVHNLPPSKLPPALEYMHAEDSPSDDESEDGERSSNANGSSDAAAPLAGPQVIDLRYDSLDDEACEESESDSDAASNGEVDFLAAARKADPEAIRQREREYDANLADRLAEEIPAGSSAATAGGGSGFASPEKGVSREEYRRALRDAHAKRTSLKGDRTSSVDVHMNDESDSGGEEMDEIEEVSDVSS